MATPPSQGQAFGVIRHQEVELGECCEGLGKGADPAPESSSPGCRRGWRYLSQRQNLTSVAAQPVEDHRHRVAGVIGKTTCRRFCNVRRAAKALFKRDPGNATVNLTSGLRVPLRPEPPPPAARARPCAPAMPATPRGRSGGSAP